MDADDYQWKALRTCMELSSTQKYVEYCAHGLSGESGEISEIVKKWAYHGHSFDKEGLIKELGDLQWYIAVMAHKLGYNLADVMERNLTKLADRYPEGFSTERSMNRDHNE